MADIRSQVVSNGKLIYQLTSASALKDTDLFPISSTDNLTRNVSLGQIKASFNNDYYNKDNIDDLLDQLRQQIKDVSDDIFDLGNVITEFRNEFNNKLNQLDTTLREEINNLDKEHTEKIERAIKMLSDFDNTIMERIDFYKEEMDLEVKNLQDGIDYAYEEINNLDTSLSNKITNLNTTLSNRITETETRLTNMINGLISYGAAVPTSLATGKVYLQYF